MTTQARHIYNLQPDQPDNRDHLFEVSAPIVLPASMDLRPYMPVIYDQGELGSCTANSVSAAVDYYRSQKGHPFCSPSRLFVYYNERSLEGHVSSDAGASVRDSVKAVSKLGAPCEAEWPYDIKKFKDKPTPTCYADALINFTSGFAYQSVPQDLVALKTALAKKLPVLIGIQVYQSFESDKVAKTGMVPMPKKTETCLGGHAVLMVGYDDQKKAFLVRNSWGTEWGLAGYFYLPYKYVTSSSLADDFWVITE